MTVVLVVHLGGSAIVQVSVAVVATLLVELMIVDLVLVLGSEGVCVVYQVARWHARSRLVGALKVWPVGCLLVRG